MTGPRFFDLVRVATGPGGTFGVLCEGGIPLCVTCEDPWNNNAVGKSCIPAGTYGVVPHDGEKYKDVWRLENVKGRSAILIHAGNTINDTQGCILVGRSFTMFADLPAILDSRDALELLRKELPDKFTLRIRGAP